jgi:3-deoxy-D-manno-octulosonate 8-phosphate phosphatase (KDO 8-P phosphatase)
VRTSPPPSQDVLDRAAQIRLLICDVDGVLTDGRLYFTPDGQELKSFHARDGHGIKLLQRTGVATAVISGRSSPAVALRMNSLGVEHVYQGRESKLEPFEELLDLLHISPRQTAYVGDDLLDLPLLRRVGLAVAVADAHFSLTGTAHWITTQSGGQGAVREVCDLIMQAQNTLQAIIESYY